MLAPFALDAIELSALRERELEPLVNGLETLHLSSYSYVSVHAPSQFAADAERRIVELLTQVTRRNWPVIVHPDCIFDHRLWRPLGPMVCFENMDKRKPIGRTADDLGRVFDRFPDASFCFDVGHAWQIDRTMSEARLIVRRFRDRMRQVHVSDVNTRSQHVPLTLATVTALRKIAELIPPEVPWINEAVVCTRDAIERELSFLRESLAPVAVQISD